MSKEIPKQIIVTVKESSCVESRVFNDPIDFIENSSGFLKVTTYSSEVVLINHDIIETVEIL